MAKATVDEIDALLPQTQCGLCGHGGCMPYAEAICYDNETINKCPPGGITTLHALALQLDIDATPFEAEVAGNAKPATTVIIREAECIGCTKCIQVCPVDAIVGAAKLMHTVLTDECTGCDLCIPACPVDCIDIIANPEPITTEKRDQFRTRHQQHLRIQRERSANKKIKTDKKHLTTYINAAIARVKAKKAE